LLAFRGLLAFLVLLYVHVGIDLVGYRFWFCDL